MAATDGPPPQTGAAPCLHTANLVSDDGIVADGYISALVFRDENENETFDAGESFGIRYLW